MGRATSRKRPLSRTTARVAPPRRSWSRLTLGAVCVLCVAVGLLGLFGWKRFAGSRPTSTQEGGATAAPVSESTAFEQRLLTAITQRPTDPAAHLALGRLYAEQGRAAEAAWEYRESASLNPASLPAQKGLATELGRLRLYELSIPLLETKLRHDPTALSLRRALAEQLLTTGRPDRAVEVLTADRDGVRHSPEALLTLGHAQMATGRLDEARRVFQEHRRVAPESGEGLYWQGRLAWIGGDAEAARRSWEAAARLAPDDPRFPLSLGMSYARDPAPGSVDRAGRAFDEALQRRPDYGPARVQLGLLFLRHGRAHEAARECLKAIDSAPTDPEPHLHLAAALDALGEKAEACRHRGLSFSLSDQQTSAIAEYRRLAALDPDGVDAPLLISQSHVQLQQNDRAAAVVAAALRRRPGDPALTERLATLYMLTHSRAEAEQLVRSWLQRQPDDARPHWLLGRVAYDNRQYDEAVREDEAALARDPTHPEYLVSLAEALARKPEAAAQQRALGLIQRAVEREGSRADLRLQFGTVLQRAGRSEDARLQFLAALSLDPDQSAAYNGLTQVAQALRRPDQVALWARATRASQERLRLEKSLRREAGQHPEEPALCFALARALLQSGELDRAQSQLEQALRLRPTQPEAQRLRAQVAALRAVL
jgi:tetratricopeptide (TPR) repeat protein